MNNSTGLKIGIVNDMALAVEALRQVLQGRPQHKVIWVARDGNEAVTHCARETPDLVLMDLIMPSMGGVEATRQIMSATPCAILIVTVNVGTNASKVFEAMGYGALDAVDTPQLGTGDTRNSTESFLAKLDAIERRLRNGSSAPDVLTTPAAATSTASGLVAIGASAGGPAALASLLHDFPKDFPAAVIIVQHLDKQFTSGMVDWLNLHSTLPVRLATEGMQPMSGTVLLAGGDEHLIFKNAKCVGYTPEPRELVYRPSVDVFFESVRRHWSGAVVGVLLTGMGRDGARGLKALHDAGRHTIAQDRATSAVYGMPKAAVDLGAASEVLSIHRIAAKLTNVFSAKV